MKISKAVITAAGYGTRFFPITKTIQKEMLPILNKPVIDYIVDDCIRAGIEEIIFVVRQGTNQLKHYYSEDRKIYDYLKKMQKLDKYPQLEELFTKARFTFVEQPDEAVYGTATPVKLVKNLVENEEAFLVLMGDDFIYNADGSSEVAGMIDLFKKSSATGLATFYPRPENLLHKYGIAEYQEKNGFKLLRKIVEKPDPDRAPSNLANISKYILTPEIFGILEKQKINAAGELFITDSVSELCKQGEVVIHATGGEYLDCGYLQGWLEANLTIAMQNPEIKNGLQDFLQTMANDQSGNAK